MIITHTCFNQASKVKTFWPIVSITSIEEPADDFMYVSPDIIFESEKVSYKSENNCWNLFCI